MPNYSKRSRLNLSTSHKDLQVVFNYVIKYWDCSVIWGHRGELDQNKAFAKGYSKLKFPKSKHNILPSLAVDVVPYPTYWEDEEKLIRFGSFVKWFAGVLFENGVIKNKVEWGGDWKSFPDPAHFEIYRKSDVDPKKIKKGSLASELYYNG